MPACSLVFWKGAASSSASAFTSVAFLSTLTHSRSNESSSAPVRECTLRRAHLCHSGEELGKPKGVEVSVGDGVDEASFDLVFRRRCQIIIVLVDLFVGDKTEMRAHDGSLGTAELMISLSQDNHRTKQELEG